MTEARTVLAAAEAMPTRLTPDDVGSDVLAPVMLPLMSASGVLWEMRTRLIEGLCDLTLRMAAEHVPYWQRHLPARGSAGIWDWLRTVRPINRMIVEEHREEFISPLTRFAFCSLTSGTTRGQPLLVERSEQEQAYLYNLFTRMNTGRMHTAAMPLTLSGGNIHHGDVLQLPGDGYALTVNLYSDAGYTQAAWLLCRSFSWDGFEPRISSITASYSCLYRLYRYLQQRGLHLPRGQIRWLSTYGSPIPSARRRELAAFFAAPVHDNWSMTECFGGAGYCERCEGYHMSPFAIEEVLPATLGKGAFDRAQTQDPMEEGIGELTLTPLFPFCQRFVLIRYGTGDLVERVRTEDCATGRYVVRPLGRLKNSVRLADGTWVSTVRIAMALDAVAELRKPRTALKCLADPSAGELPYFRLSAQPGGQRATVEVYPAESFTSAQALERIQRAAASKLENLPVDVVVATELPPELESAWKI
jgi:hypothetical protein